jgi:predicted phosphodiesterase
MLVLVISDIHANLAALEAVLADARQFDYKAVWCLGDIVGYGPEPDECVNRIRCLEPIIVAGNHDWAVVDRMDINDFNPEAGRAVLWSRLQMSQENLAWLSSLPSEPQVLGEFTLTHGSPRNPVWEYILNPAVARANFDHFDTPYCLVGHTHVPALYVSEGKARVSVFSAQPGRLRALSSSGRMILNPGSVGQPRDNDPRAAYTILDTEKATWLSCRVPYPVEVTQAHMRTAGLPERLINRLSFGW